MALMKKYKQPSYEKANKEANKRYRDSLTKPKYVPTDTTGGPNYNVPRKSTAPSTSVVRQSDDVLRQGPNYKSSTKDTTSSAEKYANNPVVQDYVNNLSANKEVATGSLSTKSEASSTSSEDRMSWAREAERKARKMMGGN
jgi:hypothetical protein